MNKQQYPGQRRTGFSRGFFSPFCLRGSFGSIAAVASGLLSWGHLISSDYRKFDFTDTI